MKCGARIDAAGASDWIHIRGRIDRIDRSAAGTVEHAAIPVMKEQHSGSIVFVKKFAPETRGRTLEVASDTDTELHEVAAELLARLQLGRRRSATKSATRSRAATG